MHTINMTVLIPLAIVFGVPALLVAIASRTSKPLKLQLKKAEEIVRQRLNAREDAQPTDLLAAFPVSARELAWAIIAAVAATVNVSPGRFRPDDKLNDVLTAHFDDGSTMQAYALEVLSVLKRQLSARAWKIIQKRLEPQPTSEDMWLDVLFELRFTELVKHMATAREEE